jgi:hypothetical protein
LSIKYEGRDEACPLSTGGKGGGRPPSRRPRNQPQPGPTHNGGARALARPREHAPRAAARGGPGRWGGPRLHRRPDEVHNEPRLVRGGEQVLAVGGQHEVEHLPRARRALSRPAPRRGRASRRRLAVVAFCRAQQAVPLERQHGAARRGAARPAARPRAARTMNETCPFSTGGGTRRVQLVRGEGRDVSS